MSRRLSELLIAAARATRDVLADPAPFVLQISLNDFSITYELNAYTANVKDLLHTQSELHQNIQDTFNEAGVEIMSPHYTQIRDGSHTTIPADYVPPDYEAPAIKIANLENMEKKTNK